MTSFLSRILLAPIFLLAVLVGACSAPEPERVVEFRDRPTATLAGSLIVPDEIEPLGIPVFAEGTSFMAVTDDEGRFRISGMTPGEYRIRAARPDIETLTLGQVVITEADLDAPQPFRTLDPVEVQVRERGAGREIGLRASALATITGRVTAPVAGDERGVLILLDGTSHSVSTANDGSFTLQDVRPGVYTLSAMREGYQRATREITVQAGDTFELDPIRLTLQEAPPTNIGTGDRSLFGRVNAVTADGRAFNDFRSFRVILEGTQFSATPDREGRFTFQGLPPSSYLVVAEAPGWILERQFAANLNAVASAEINLTLLEDILGDEEFGSIIGRVFLEAGEPPTAAGVIVSLTGTNLITTTDRDGFFSFIEVPPGGYDIQASFPGWRPGTTSVNVQASLDPSEAGAITLERDIIAPRIVFTNPADNARNVTIDQPTRVVLQFSDEMDTQSVINAVSVTPNVGFRVVSEGAGGGRSTFVVELAGVPLDNRPALRYGTAYTIRVAASARSLRGAAMERDFQLRLTTGFAEIIASLPGNNETGFIWSENRPLRLFFNAPIDERSIRREDITIRPAVGYNFFLRRDPSTGWTILNITGTPNLGETYEITVRGARTVTGDRVRNLPFRMRFTTNRGRTVEEEFGTTPTDIERRQERERGRQ